MSGFGSRLGHSSTDSGRNRSDFRFGLAFYDRHPRITDMASSDKSANDGEQSKIMRHVVRDPQASTAGFAVAHVRNPPPTEAEYRIEQLWPNGRADPVHIGDREDALKLISALTEAILE